MGNEVPLIASLVRLVYLDLLFFMVLGYLSWCLAYGCLHLIVVVAGSWVACTGYYYYHGGVYQVDGWQLVWCSLWLPRAGGHLRLVSKEVLLFLLQKLPGLWPIHVRRFQKECSFNFLHTSLILLFHF